MLFGMFPRIQNKEGRVLGQARHHGNVKNVAEAMNLESGSPDIPQLHSVIDARLELIVNTESISDFSCEERSQDAYRAKEVKLIVVPQSGDEFEKEKDFRRAKYLRAEVSRKFDRERHKAKKEKSTWSPEERREAMRKYIKKIDPHAGLELSLKGFASSFECLKNSPLLESYPVSDDAWNKMENALLFLLALSECVSLTQGLSITTLYIKTHYSGSLAQEALRLFTEFFASEEEVEPHAGLSKPAWLTQLREVCMNWQIMRNNPVFKKVSFLLSVLVTLGLCDAAHFNWTCGGIRLFSINALEKHASAFDLIDAAMDTFLYFVEGGYYCFVTKSMKPLLYSNQAALEFDDDFNFLVANLSHVKTGNLTSMLMITENEYACKLDNSIVLARTLQDAAKSTWERKIFSDKLTKLNTVKTEFDAVRVRGGLKVQPFTLNVFGKSSVGKSTVAQILMAVVLKCNGYAASDEYLYTLNEADPFLSGYRSFMNGVFLDDLGNTHPDFLQKSPASHVIEISNNVKKQANMADLDSKGKVSMEPKAFLITTNSKDMCSTLFSLEPASVERRAHYTLTVRVKPEFCADTLPGFAGQQLDSSKVEAHYTDAQGNINVPPVPDCWLITVERACAIPNKVKGKRDTVGFMPQFLDGKELRDVSIHEVLKFMIAKSRIHFPQQERLVQGNKNLADKIELCACKMPKMLCDCYLDRLECTEIPPVVKFDGDLEQAEAEILKEERRSNPEVVKRFYQVEVAARYGHLKDGNCHPGKCLNCHSYHPPRGSEGKLCIQTLMNELANMHDVPFMEYDDVFKESRNEPHGGIGTYAGTLLRGYYDKHSAKFTAGCAVIGIGLEKVATAELVMFLRWLEESPYFSWTNYIPQSVLKNSYGKQFIEYAMKDHLLSEVKQAARQALASILFFFIMGVVVHPIFLFPVLYFMYVLAVVVKTTKQRVLNTICERNDAMPTVFKQVRDNHLQYVLAALGVFGALYTLCQVFKGFRTGPSSEQGLLDPKSDDDIAKRDAEVNPWAGVYVADVEHNEIQKCTTTDQLCNKVFNNQVFLRFRQGTQNRISGGVFVKGNVLLMPRHIWYVDGVLDAEPLVEITRHDRNKTGSHHEARLSATFKVDIPETDLCLVWAPSCGSHKNIIDYLPISSIRSSYNKLVFRGGEGERVDATAQLTPAMTGHSQCMFQGGNTHLSINTFNGLCMAAYVSTGSTTQIQGFHLGGKTGTPQGVCGMVTQAQVNDAVARLEKVPGVICALSEGKVPTTQYGVEFLTSKNIDPKSPVNYMQAKSNFKVFGTCLGKQSSHSEVVPTLISDTVEAVCGVPQQWGKPQMKPDWKPWQASLSHSSNPSSGIEGSLLQRAMFDYMNPLIAKVKSQNHKFLRPLTKLETLAGIDGVRFIDKMPTKTAIGYPLTGPKSDHITLLDPAEYPDHNHPVELDPKFWDEAEKLEERYLSGERGYPIFKGCLKDEPTKLTKDKVRVFQAAPIALQLLVRKYFLPIVRLLSVNPLLSECAVGINAQGPEWHEFQAFIVKYGLHRIFAGDYGKYDLRMAAQLILVAFYILIQIGDISPFYGEREAIIMRGVSTDIAYAMTAYNGTLIQFIGSNPSGQNMTVYINSIVNSLAVRCGFFHARPEATNFRSHVAMGTYGDDVKGSVKEGDDRFNIVSYIKFLAERDMVFTMPDKESEPVPFMHDQDADFLKRKNTFNEEVGMYFGALDESSIFKSLHATLKSKFLSEEEQSIANMNGALREWFAHGKDVYEMRRSQMKEVASRHGLIVSEAEIPYEVRMESWKEKYLVDTEDTA